MTLAGDACCGILEHSHDEACGAWVRICEYPEEGHVQNNGCDQYWYVDDAGNYTQNGYCHCWTPTGDTTFTFSYKTDDYSMVGRYGGLGYQLRNVAELYYKPNGVREGVQVDGAQDSVSIPGMLDKKEIPELSSGYTAHYRITVNEAKLTLTNNVPLNIRDAMTDTLAYNSGSLVITTEDANGATSVLRQDMDYTVAYDGTGSVKDDNNKPIHTLDIVILRPQPVKYILDYDTTIIIPDDPTEGIKYSNSATISLWGEDITDSTAEKVYADFNIAAKNYRVDMYKTASETGQPLSGARFGLYNAQGGLITSDVTDEYGQLDFETNIIQGIILREHMLYYMQELKVPPGYRLDDTKYWFCFCDSTSGHCDACDQVMAGTDAFRIPFEQIEKISVQNELLSYSLPGTGGPGVYPLIYMSVVCIVAPLVYGCIRRRKREGRGVE